MFLATQHDIKSCKEIMEHISCVMWHLWKFRNKLVFGEEHKEWCTIFQEGVKLAVDYNEANKKSGPAVGSGTLGRATSGMDGHVWPSRWSKPAGRTLKLNCDAAWKSETRSGKLGVVCRDAKDNFQGVISRWLTTWEVF
ncbi:hypothetical protein LIER_10659 [Lithospermum erythrorhizon]|uniref:Uncharacterized protein n=1 Tax=Lithospermum erythrorhizon TaxID=34254 RepID=A0AAV3PP52_LITER